MRSAECPDGKDRVGSDAGRQANARRVGSTQRRKKYAKPPPTKNSFAAWRTSRLCVRSDCRGLTPGGGTPIGGRNPLGNTPSGFTPPVLPRSRPPVLRAERRRPNAERRSAECPDGKGRCRIGRWQAGECTAGWFHATAPRRTPRKPPPTKNLLCGVAYLAPLREIRPPRPDSRGRHTERRPSPFGQHAPGFRVLREPGNGKETGGFEFALRGRVAQIALTRFPPSLARPVLPFSGPGAGRLTSFGF